MASLGSLPAEVFGLIVGPMADGHWEGTLAALAATCRGFYRLAMPHLYHRVADRHPSLLHWAAYVGRVSTASRLVDAGAPLDIHMQWDVSQGVFEAACAERTPRHIYQCFRARIESGNILMTKTIRLPKPFWFPIHLAAMRGNLEIVELLVKTWPETVSAPSYRLCKCLAAELPGPARLEGNPDWYLPLHVAACHGHCRIVQCLLEHGCTPVTALRAPARRATLRDAKISSTALHDAARFGQGDLIRFIIDGGYQEDVHELDGRQLSPIWHAYLHGQWEAVDMLLARGADIDDDVGCGYTPLVDACLCGDFGCAVKLIDRGANPNVEFHGAPRRVREHFGVADLERRGVRPLDICCWLHRDAPRRISCPELSSDEASKTWVPRHPENWDDYYTQRDQRLLAVSRLLGAGAHLEPAPGGHPPPLVVAAANHLTSVVDELIKHGAPVNLADRDGVSPLAAVFAYNQSYCSFHPWLSEWALVERPFVSNGKPRRVCMYEGNDPDRGGCSELRICFDILLKNGADVNQADVNGNTPLCHLFTAPCFRTHLNSSGVRMLWITPADRSWIAPLMFRYGAKPKDTMTPVSVITYGRKATDTAWAACRWPRTLMEHAFWDADYEACQRLLEAGVIPGQDTVLWMMRILLEESLGRYDTGTPEGLDFIERLPVKLRDTVLRNPLCLTIALRRGWLDIAQRLWNSGPELCQFSEEYPMSRWDVAAPAPDGELVELGVQCLHAATRWGAGSIFKGLLALGVKPIPPCALLVAVRRGNYRILESLVEHGGTIHVRERETDERGSLGVPTAAWQHQDGCINPVKLAIKLGKSKAIRIMLGKSKSAVDPWFRYFYLKEAYTLLDPAIVACLLEHPSMRFGEADITDEADLPLSHLVRHARSICSMLPLRHRNPVVGPRASMENVGKWIGCVAAFARAGVDATMKDRGGKSALDYLREHMAYAGPDRFRRHLASELQDVVEAQTEDPLDATACYEALKLADTELDC